ncbi:cupin domain-containing protein [Mycolicibacterium pyrenivorans]|uniref:cupin domain-containing protein n=1 Tax=Mycolicibacterium pyrenivorans TaxID=187102 RepID=UPI0021F38937|nr:cupin domain-containing protein [Mycolicibacterium pyrenivorans]MCV7151604.1 MerR family transcriptional regulator [Mycolicibacterium pyrenivorans]
MTAEVTATNGRGGGHAPRRLRTSSPAAISSGPAPPSDGQGIYIQQAAQLVGATAVQLRAWEQQQLISPARTASGYRVYTIDDIERMQRIKSLVAGGVNAEGVRRILNGPGYAAGLPAALTAASSHSRNVGNTVRSLRKERGLTLRDLSQSTGLSASYISSVERGAAAPSIASLQKIGAVFDTNVLALMSESYEAPCSPVVRAEQRRVLDSDKGVRIEDLSTAGSNLEPLLFTFQPGCGSDGAISHEGEEFLYVMSGQLYLCLDGSDEYYLNPGDSMGFRSERAHEFGNPGDVPSAVLWINTPRTF